MIENKEEIERLLSGYLTTKKAGAKLDVTPERIRQMIKEKKLEAILIAGVYFIDPKDLKKIPPRAKPGPKPKDKK